MLFFLSYIGLVFYIAFVGGFWVYPVLEYFDGKQRALFIFSCAVFAICLYMAGEACNYSVWGKPPQDITYEKSSHVSVSGDKDLKRKRTSKNKSKYY